MAPLKHSKPAPAASVNESPAAVLSAATAHQCAPLGAIILDLGARLGALDKLSRKVLAVMLQQLTETPDDAEEIARLASAVVTVQKPMVRDAALHQAMTRPDACAYVVSKRMKS